MAAALRAVGLAGGKSLAQQWLGVSLTSSAHKHSTGFVRHLAEAAPAAEPADPEPLVADKIVSVTVYDLLGRRHLVKGLVGKTLLDVLRESPALQPEYLRRGLAGGKCYGNCGNCHVTVANEWLPLLAPPSPAEVDAINQIKSVGATPNYRLGCHVVMNKDLDGLVVSIREFLPWFTV